MIDQRLQLRFTLYCIALPVYATAMLLALVFGPLMIAILMALGYGVVGNRPLPWSGAMLLVTLGLGWIVLLIRITLPDLRVLRTLLHRVHMHHD